MSEGTLRPTRYAHLEGFTDLCYSDDGQYIITCGQDGEVRIFEGLDDDDCKTHVLADCAYAIAYMDGSILVGTDQNMVQSYTVEEGKPNGIISRFTAAPTHISVCKARNIVAMGSSDMTIKVNEIKNYKETHLSGHEAPVLSVAVDSQGEFLASASCDGTVRVWDLVTKKAIHSMNILTKSNSFSFAESICRLCWTLDDRYLIVPVKTQLIAYSRHSWKQEFYLKDDSINENLSVINISPCGSYVACGSKGGHIAVFNIESRKCVASVKNPKGGAITGLKWNPSGKPELAYVNNGGQLGTFIDFLSGDNSTKQDQKSNDTNHVSAAAPGPPLDVDDSFPPLNAEDLLPDDDEDDAEFSISKIKSQLGFADDEYGTFIGIPAAEKKDVDVQEPTSHRPTPSPVPAALELPEPQRPFQPGMSPEHLSDRYMVWNNTGIVRQYTSDEEHSIEVEFHDSSVHHALHLNNHFNHSIAALSNQVLALASESEEDQLSKLVVHHFAAWDGSKEWQTDMPEGEDVIAIGLGKNWICAGTDTRNLRLFTTSGVQRDVISIPGPIVCISGYEDIVFVVFHSGIGAGGEQAMSAIIFNLTGQGHILPVPCPIPLSPNSFLAWAGFTDEGSPIIVDSVGMVKQLNNKFGPSWTPILNTRNHVKGKSDNYFVLGASETEGNVRCILCKGNRYPVVLPRPHVSFLNIKIPVCEPESEKSELEETMIRTCLKVGTIEKLAQRGFDVEVPKTEAEKSLKETMIKLFALCCRSDRESRGLEVCNLMTSYHAVQLAIKYAGKLHRVRLAERLGEVAEKKMEEEMKRQTEEEDFMESLVQRHSYSQDIPREDDYQQSSMEIDFDEQPVEGIKAQQVKDNPLLAAANRIANKTAPLSSSLIPSNRNPFKKSVGSSGGVKGLDVLDTLKTAKRKNEDVGAILRPVVKRPKTSKQSQIKGKAEKIEKENRNSLGFSINTNEMTQTPKSEPPKSIKKTSALQLWLEDNLDIIKEQFPDVPESGIYVKAALLFKDVEDSVKQKYKQLVNVKQSTQEPTESLAASNVSIDSQQESEKPKSFSSKLKAFSFSKS